MPKVSAWLGVENGVTKEAVTYFRVCAEKGKVLYQHDLADMHAQGKGVQLTNTTELMAHRAVAGLAISK